jgi:hypothetical protein
MAFAIIVVALIAFLGLRLWLQHQRRVILHKERLAAIEKGVEMPPVEEEVKRSNRNVQRFLLLAGLIWVSVGIGLYVVIDALLKQKTPENHLPFTPGFQWVGVGPAAIGISHLIVYFVSRNKNS